MNAKQQAAHDLRRFGQMLKGIIAIGDDLEILGSIEQAEAEARSRIIKLQGEEVDIRQRLVDADATLQAATMSVESVKRKAQEEADGIWAGAVNTAAAHIEDAKRQAANVVSVAKQEARDLDAALKDKRGLLRGLNADITSAQTRLDEVNAMLAAARRKLG